ncbi:MAG: porin family protein [Gammaproteobacteria bacterium]|nr:porin family protein [Gammaproteobacteria bacterium]
MKRTAIVGLLALASASTQAAPDVPGWRAGIEGSFSNYRTLSDNTVGFKLFGQYQFNKWFGIEGAYHGIGDFEKEYPNDSPPDNLKLNFSGFSAQGVLYVPWPFDFLGWQAFDGVEAFAKAGYYDFSDQLSNNSGTTSSAESGQVAGGGFILEISDNLGVRAEYEWFDAKVGDITSVSIGFVYGFGGEKAAATSTSGGQ